MGRRLVVGFDINSVCAVPACARCLNDDSLIGNGNAIAIVNAMCYTLVHSIPRNAQFFLKQHSAVLVYRQKIMIRRTKSVGKADN